MLAHFPRVSLMFLGPPLSFLESCRAARSLHFQQSPWHLASETPESSLLSLPWKTAGRVSCCHVIES